ncbi:MAG: ATP-binding protein [Streptosporangiaceae bacterium]
MELAEDLGRRWTWALPPDASCARTARRLLRVALTHLGVDDAVIDDAALMASELATNAHQHAAQHPPHELWLYSVGDFEFCCAVFDAFPARTLPVDFHRSDFGRGLSIVAELSKGRWGTDSTWARLDPQVRGKAVWFTCSR